MWLMRSVAKLRLTHISFKLIPQTLYTTVIVCKYAAYIFDCYQMLGFFKKKKRKNIQIQLTWLKRRYHHFDLLLWQEKNVIVI